MAQAEQECMEITQMPTLDSITEEELYLLTLNFLGRIFDPEKIRNELYMVSFELATYVE